MILAIDTSCDETAAALTEGRRVISNVIYSQILIHKKWGGVVPSLAKRAHEKKIDKVIDEVIKKAKKKDIDYIAVTQGPGLAVALEVGIKKAKELAKKYDKKLVAVNHLEGHIYSPFVQNSKGNPNIDFDFPYLVLIASGGHTSLLIFKDHLQYQVLGETVDDAAGEALDKAAKLLGLGYPGGPVIERLSQQVDNKDFYRFPRPMLQSNNLNFSFSGLKTSFYYFLKKINQADKLLNIKLLASSFQEAVFDTLIKKTEKAINLTKINHLLVVGGVSANLRLKTLMKRMIKKHQGKILFPPNKNLTGDNAAMIGVAAYYKVLQNKWVRNIDSLDRIPRLNFNF
ncbi:MAG: tRNA (adenosine(37)-N6)-threonylcarbamoyltransferase complex transferase subunit TsaD [Microgenomates group bacterium]|nr:tRNA (adenosine(37)-N6)-threonylcarbamoyltransferase complex transferase subunit TsaD [Microgenomates group bacterium]